ncbi:DMT family transporter [Paenibacillus sp. MBLB4367]|uniref:DMT family transporter n=1 Tax=Paenibacillus sp. MBLB4367 TaxID=3384767 RepID=UPI003907EBE1
MSISAGWNISRGLKRMIDNKPQSALPHLALVASFMLWGINIISMKVGGREWEPLVFNGLRYASILPVLWGYALYYRYSANRSRPAGEAVSYRMERRDLWLVIGLGVLSAVGLEAMFSYALQYSNAANGAVLGRGFMPVITVLFALWLREIRLTPRLLVGLPLAICCVAIVVAGGSEGLHFTAETLRGDVLLLLRSILGALYLIGMNRLVKKYPLPLLVAIEMTAGAAALLPAVLIQVDANMLTSMSASGWISLAYTALFGTVLGFYAHNWSLGKLGPVKASVYGFLLPVMAAIAGYVLLNESLSAYQLIGGTGVLAAMYIVQRDRYQKRAGDPISRSAAEHQHKG